MGHRHPNTIALEEVERIFIGMGYEVVEGPEIEYDEYNFTKLNIPPNHPAKDEQDTFYITDDILLRTQTLQTYGGLESTTQGKLLYLVQSSLQSYSWQVTHRLEHPSFPHNPLVLHSPAKRQSFPK